MRYWRLILLLVVSIALRGFAGAAYALPVPPAMETMGMSEACEHEPTTPAPMHHAPGDKACQISCDLTVSPALPVSFLSGVHVTPPVLTALQTVLQLRDPAPPDHPPPIA